MVVQLLNAILEKVVKRSYDCIARPLVSLIGKLIGHLCSLPIEYLRRQNNIYPTNILENIPESDPPIQAEAIREDRILPCLERLQKLEDILEELRKRPAQIPVEKEHMLHHSLDRIKSVEFDLNKTKRVGFYNIIINL